jgi:hypothetical protein
MFILEASYIKCSPGGVWSSFRVSEVIGALLTILMISWSFPGSVGALLEELELC